MPYSTLRDKKNQLIRKARDGSVFVAPSSAPAITTLTTTGTNEVQTVTISGTPTGGTFTLSFGGQTTTALAFSATATVVQSALTALSSIGAGNVTVTGGPGPGTPYTVTFTGRLGSTNVAQLTGNATGLTGGTTPAVTVATTTPGVAIDLSPLPTGYADLGWTTSDGVTFARNTNVADIQSFGSVQPTRSDITSDTITMNAVAQQTQLSTIGMYIGADTTNLMAAAGSGELSIAKPARPGFRYYRVLGLFVDESDFGEIYIARFMPRARITEVAEQVFADGDTPIQYGLTFTGYEDSALGFSHKFYFAGPGWNALLSDMGITQGP